MESDRHDPDGIDMYRAAKLPIDRYGNEAPIHAAMRPDTLMAEGDLGGQAIWKLIPKAIDELLANERPEDAGLH